MLLEFLSKSHGALGTVERTVTSQIPEYYMSNSDFAVYVDATQGPMSITLPTASDAEKIVFIQKIDGSDNVVLVKCLGDDRMNRVDSLRTTRRLDGWTLVADGEKTWSVISKSTGSPLRDDGQPAKS
jgi:hypothetical protein